MKGSLIYLNEFLLYSNLSSDKKNDELNLNLQQRDEQVRTDDTKILTDSQQKTDTAPHTSIHQVIDDHPHSKRNYASKECAAKVLYSNEEAENKGAILNDPERDDYMRNPCRILNKFLIIELCETIQVFTFSFIISYNFSQLHLILQILNYSHLAQRIFDFGAVNDTQLKNGF